MSFRSHIIDTDNGFVRTGLPKAKDMKLPFYIYAFGRTYSERPVKYTGSTKCNIICTEKGCGKVLINGKWIEVPVGSAIYYPTYAEVQYEAVDETPWSTVFFTFAGQFAESVLGLETCVISGDLSFISKAVDELDDKYLSEEWPEYSNAILTFCLHRLSRISSGLKPNNNQGDDTHNKLLASIKRITNRVSDDIPLSFLADSCGVTVQHYCRLFKAYTGTTPTAYIISLRISRACDLLTKDKNRKIEDISQDCGFNSVAYFNKTFKKVMGISPREYRKNMKTE